VKFHEAEEYVFRQGDPKGHFVWTIQQGRVELVEERPTGEHLRDVLGEGDHLAWSGSPATGPACIPPVPRAT